MNIISAMKNSAAGFDELPAFIMKQCSKFYIIIIIIIIFI